MIVFHLPLIFVLMKRKLIYGIAICFAGLQFFRPTITHPPVTGDLQAPADVKKIIERACYDCHSNTPNLRWYDQVVPAYWLVANHIKDGRAALNFSNWDSLSAGDQKSALWLAVNQVLLGAMPPSAYTAIHSGAKLDDKDLQVLKNYLLTQQAAPAKAPAMALSSVTNVQPALNGINYIAGYTDWQVVNTTDRFDNGTLRVIYGNDVAIKAIQSNHTHPWPDGTIFAKVAWKEDTDSNGIINPGAFWQVEFMIRNSQQYADTKGWGWARWRGNDLKPYGKTATFSKECISCHEPMKDKDYVFTIPDTLVAGKLITTHYDRNRQLTTAIVKRPDNTYAQILRQIRPDPHWFGANIPGKPVSVNFTTFTDAQPALAVP